MSILYSTLSNEAEIIMGQSPAGDTYNSAGYGTPLLNGPTEFGPVYPTARQWTTSPTKMCRPGDILFCVRGATAGRTNFADKEYCLGRGLAAIRVRQDRFAGSFLHHVIAAGYASFQARGVGSTFINISSEQLSKFQVPLFALSEQRHIAAILDQADEVRRKRCYALKRVGSIVRAIFEEMFGANGAAVGSARVDPLGDHLSFITSGGRNWARYYTPTGSRFIRSLDVQMNTIGDEDIVFVNPPENAEARRTKVACGDVLLTITGSRIGRVAPVPDELAGSYISQHVAILRPKPSMLPVFLSLYLSREEGGQRQIAKKQYGQTKPGLNFEQINAFSVPVPSRQLQEQFVKRCREVDNLVNLQRTQLSKLDSLFCSLQHRALSGELTEKRAASELEMAG